jgi:hypothetical protein
MDCPSCGLINPSEARKCDCGYDFSSGKAAEAPGWPIELSWGQKMAAYWSITWPAFAGFFLLLFLEPFFSIGVRQETQNLWLTTLLANLFFFALEALLAQRLIRKKYRSFRIYAIRKDGARKGALSFREMLSVALWVSAPQFLWMLLAASIIWLGGKNLSPQAARSISTIALWTRFLFVGPYALDFALRVEYSTFHFETNAMRYL